MHSASNKDEPNQAGCASVLSNQFCYLEVQISSSANMSGTIEMVLSEAGLSACLENGS